MRRESFGGSLRVEDDLFVVSAPPAFEVFSCPCEKWTLEVPYPYLAWLDDIERVMWEHYWHCPELHAVVHVARQMGVEFRVSVR